MEKFTAVNLDKCIKDFSQLEQKITELKGKNNILEIKLDETNRLLKFSQTKEKYLMEERDGMLSTVKGLQHTLQQQCDLRVDNEKLRNTVLDVRKQSEVKMEECKAHTQRLEAEMGALREQHLKEMDDSHRETQRKLETKDVEVKEALKRNESTLEEMGRKIRDQEKEKQSETLKLQMEFSAKLARAQSMSMKTQQQPQGSCPLPQNIFKRKLQFMQEEKNREIEALRQRVKDLEQQQLHGFSDSRLKRRKI